jgi:short-chain fatty acids transporter
VLLVCIGALAMGAKPTDTAKAFGDGFWSLIRSPCRWPSW